jgi:hypothetical protein
VTPLFRRSLERRIARRFFLRWHMTLILAAVALAGVVASKILLILGVRSLPVRYALAIGISYAAFFLWVRLWLAYAWHTWHQERLSPGLDVDSLVDRPGGSITPFDVPSADPAFHAGGGQFGGGGASGTFDATSGADTSSAAGGNIGDTASLADVPGDEGCLIVIVLGVFLVVVGGVGLYVIYVAPSILFEAFFQFVLASTLVRAARRADQSHWSRGVFASTAGPALVVLLVAVVFAVVAQRHCPGADTMPEILRRCVFLE